MGIQMNQKEVTSTFMMNFNWKNPFDLNGLYKIIQRRKGNVFLERLQTVRNINVGEMVVWR